MKTTLIAAFACLLAATAQAAGQNAQYPSFAGHPDASFGTNAKVALLWHWSEGIVRSVGVTKVSRGGKGIICVLPKVALNPKGIYPIVATVDSSGYSRAEDDEVAERFAAVIERRERARQRGDAR